MQKASRPGGLAHGDEIAVGAEQANQPHSGGCRGAVDVHGAHVLAVDDAAGAVVREPARGQLRQHAGRRHDRRRRSRRVRLDAVEGDRVSELEPAARDALERREVSAGSKPSPESVGERAHVETGRALDVQRHHVVLCVKQLQLSDGHGDRGGQGGWTGEAGWVG